MGYPRSSHLQRFLTASLLIPALFAYLCWGGPILFILLTWLGLLMGTYETIRLTRGRAASDLLLIQAGLGTVVVGATTLYGPGGLLAGVLFSTLVWFFFRVLTFRENGSFFETLGKDFFGLFYLPLFMPFFILIRNQAEGLQWIFFLLAVNYAGDTAAYYVGRTWGRHKLAPRVSPQKTIEGSLGGLIANGLTALIFQQTGLARCGAGEIMLVGGVIGVLSQFGDLTESLLKRAAGFKDSGSLFPGHGGFLDRVDSLLFPAPWLYYYLQWRGPMG